MAESTNQTPVESRADALARGAARYFTGKPCPAGHVGLRNSVLGDCCECRKIWRREEKQRARARLRAVAGGGGAHV
jgi:hypothetical protein